MKVTYTRILARKILLAFLAIVIILSIAALFVRDSISQKLADISKISGSTDGDQSKPEQILLLLHQADNDFQASLVNADSTKSADYKRKITKAFAEIDTLLTQKTDTSHLTSLQRSKVKDWYQKKLELSGQVLVIKRTFDSLLTKYADFNALANQNSDLFDKEIHKGKPDIKSSTDTIRKNGKKRGLLRRIKDAIANKDGNAGGVVEIKHNTNTRVVDQNTQKIVTDNKLAYTKKLQQLHDQNEKLLSMQRGLIILNTDINNELSRIIIDAKGINYDMAGEFKGMALKSYQESTALLNKLYLAALFFVLVFAILLIVFIIYLNDSELRLRKEIVRSVAIAQQKMDLLHHMSHEIRNPLTAIKGFLYVFSKSNMTPKQVDMLDSIKLSSDMMLQTLNDTLDAAKMENSELKINKEPFSPDFVLKKVVESMAFSATKKQLSIGYNFKGNKDVILLGDNFRLKQVMVNLLSNAIKYTDKGGIVVNAQLIGEGRLQVDITDTGAGISIEQQTDLFSKYYQTNSSKGKVGTGLGLFICQQLVKLQDGKITVKSTLGEGSTFSFYIPYEKSTSAIIIGSPADENDPLSVLNGKNILAVDDNELNLMFLKKLTEKWNVIFHQATNGKEALDIIENNDIAVVLSDLQMPVMDGKKLLANIKKLDAPLNNLPVIVISGVAEPADKEKLLKAGFVGFINKPFTQKELTEQLLKVLN